MGLLLTHQLNATLRELESACSVGYVVLVYQTTPGTFGFPQTRNRLYFVGVRADLVGDANVTLEAFRLHAARVLGALRQDWALIPQDELLLPDAHSAVQRSLAVARAKLACRSSGSDSPAVAHVSKWVFKNKAMREKVWAAPGSQSHYNFEEHAHSCPQFPLMPNREKDLLDAMSVRFPDTRCIV